MDIKELLKKGLYKDLSYNDLWELEQDAEDLAAYISQDAALAAAIGNFRTYIARRNMDLQTLEIRQSIRNNLEVLNRLRRQIDVFGLNGEGEYLYADVSPLAGFFQRLNIVNYENSDKVDASAVRTTAQRVAFLAVVQELVLNDKFSKMSPQAQEHKYVSALTEAMETYAFNLVAGQLSEDIVGKVSPRSSGDLSKAGQKQLQEHAEQRFGSMIDPASREPVKITNTNFVATSAVEISRLEKSALKLAVKTEVKEPAAQVVDEGKQISALAPETYPLAKELASVAEISFLADQNIYNAFRVNKAIRTALKKVPETSKTFFAFFHEQRKQLAVFSSAVAKGIRQAVNTIKTVTRLGLVSDKIAAGVKKVLPALHDSNEAQNSGAEMQLLSPQQVLALKHDLEQLRTLSRQAAQNEMPTSKTKTAMLPEWLKFRRSFENSRFNRIIFTENKVTRQFAQTMEKASEMPSFEKHVSSRTMEKLHNKPQQAETKTKNAEPSSQKGRLQPKGKKTISRWLPQFIRRLQNRSSSTTR